MFSSILQESKRDENLVDRDIGPLTNDLAVSDLSHLGSAAASRGGCLVLHTTPFLAEGFVMVVAITGMFFQGRTPESFTRYSTLPLIRRCSAASLLTTSSMRT